jgi:hypothetical protein
MPFIYFYIDLAQVDSDILSGFDYSSMAAAIAANPSLATQVSSLRKNKIMTKTTIIDFLNKATDDAAFPGLPPVCLECANGKANFLEATQYINITADVLLQIEALYVLWAADWNAAIGSGVSFEQYAALLDNSTTFMDAGGVEIELTIAQKFLASQFVAGNDWDTYILIPRSQSFTPTFEWYKNMLLLEFANLDLNKDNIVSLSEFMEIRVTQDRADMNIMHDFAALYPDHPISAAFALQEPESTWMIILGQNFWVTKSGEVSNLEEFTESMTAGLADNDTNGDEIVTSAEFIISNNE